MKYQITILVFFLLYFSCKGANVLATADCVNYFENTYAYVMSNSIGLSMDLLEIVPQVGNQLMQEYHLNSKIHGSWGNTFHVSMHNPIGCKYNCSLAEQIANTTLNCTFDTSNATFLQLLGDFSWNTTNWNGMAVGWDNEGANYADPTYMNDMFTSFYNTLRVTTKQPYYI